MTAQFEAVAKQIREVVATQNTAPRLAQFGSVKFCPLFLWITAPSMSAIARLSALSLDRSRNRQSIDPHRDIDSGRARVLLSHRVRSLSCAASGRLYPFRRNRSRD